MTGIRAFVIRHPVPAYFVMTFAISWGGLLVVGGPGEYEGTSWQSDPRLPLLFLAMLAGPSVAGLWLTGLYSGRSGLRDLFSRLLHWRVEARWYAVALLSAPVVFTAVPAVLSLTSEQYLPGIVGADDKVLVLLAATVTALVVGLFEELGWTGFAIPLLLRRHGAFATGLLVGVPWGAWHLLTNDFWISEAYSGGLPQTLFVAATGLTLLAGQLPAYRVLMVWVYDRTGSLPVAMLMHASLAVCTFTLGPSATGVAFLIYGFAMAAAWWLVVAAVAVVSGRQLSRHPLPRRAV